MEQNDEGAIFRASSDRVQADIAILEGRYSTERSPSAQCSLDGDIAHAKSERLPT